jgi:hypothetical protein
VIFVALIPASVGKPWIKQRFIHRHRRFSKPPHLLQIPVHNNGNPGAVTQSYLKKLLCTDSPDRVKRLTTNDQQVNEI